MSASTSIEWCDSTFNPWMGCTRVSPACDDCYAARSTPARTMGIAWGPGEMRQRTKTWGDPVRWNKQPFCECMSCRWRGPDSATITIDNPPGFHPPVDWVRGCPSCRAPTIKEARRRVFCASLADVFDNEVPADWRSDLFALIADTPNLDWLLLTKRIGNAAAMMGEALGSRWRDVGSLPLPNVWLGATVVNQAEADRDIPKLLAVPARVRFLSVEPMLGSVTLRPDWIWPQGAGCLLGLHQIIAGGESGPQARPMHADWVRGLRDQCSSAGVPFLFKQWGEWLPIELPSDEECFAEDGSERQLEGRIRVQRINYQDFARIGKKAAGRLLDGRTHDGFPEVAT